MQELLCQRMVMMVRLLVTGVLGIVLTLATSSNATAGLIARYTFEDATVTDHEVKDVAGSAVAHNMTFDSIMANSSDAKEGSKAGVFEGTTNSHGYYQVTDPADPIRTESVTVCFWMKGDSKKTDYMMPITWDDEDDKSPWNVQLSPGSGNKRPLAWKAGGSGRDAASVVPMDQWIHVAISQGQGTSGTEARVYINGKLAKQLADLATIPVDGTECLRLGSRGGLYTFKGLLDDVQIYDSALTGEEIANLHENPGSVISKP